VNHVFINIMFITINQGQKTEQEFAW